MRATGDDGFTLIELMVALVLVALLASTFLALEMTVMRSARANEGRTAGTQIAQQQLEDIVALSGDAYYVSSYGSQSTVDLTSSPAASLPTHPYAETTQGSVLYKIYTYITWYDDSADGTGAADVDGSAQDMKHVSVTVYWTLNGVSRHITVDDLRAPTATEVPPTTAVGTGLSVTATAPTTQTLSTTGYLASSLVIKATTNKAATAATLSYNARAVSKSVTMTMLSGTSWTVTLPANTTGPFDTGAQTFTVTATTASGETASGSTSVQMTIGSGGASLSVSAAPSQTLTASNTLSWPITVKATGTVKITSATVSYPTKTMTLTKTLTGSNKNWSYTVAADSTVYNSGSETFTVTVNFSDGTSATGLVTINLYADDLPPDVVSLTVVDPYSTTGKQNFCVDTKNLLYTTTKVDAVVKYVSSTDTVKMTAPGATTLEFPMSYVGTNADGSLTFEYQIQAGTQFPSTSSLTLGAYALKTIQGTQYRDDYITSPAPTIESEKRSQLCT
jgi:prepilin-type N-terminal cleavage/methylation domain-containing protein